MGFPRFSWGEGAYLRAQVCQLPRNAIAVVTVSGALVVEQIARISAATLVSPKGFYNQAEDCEL